MPNFSKENLFTQAAKSAAMEKINEFERVSRVLTRQQSDEVVAAIRAAIAEQALACKKLEQCADRIHALLARTKQ